jgi:hypothetical protein
MTDRLLHCCIYLYIYLYMYMTCNVDPCIILRMPHTHLCVGTYELDIYYHLPLLDTCTTMCTTYHVPRTVHTCCFGVLHVLFRDVFLTQYLKNSIESP